MVTFIRLFLSSFLCLNSFGIFALEQSQAQDIRLNKAKLYIHQGLPNKAFILLNQNLKRDFHADTIIFLSQYFHQKKQYLKSYRYLRSLINESLPSSFLNLKFNNENHQELITQIKKLAPLDEANYSIIQYVANRLLELHTKELVTPEHLPFLLSQAQKFLLICYAHDFRFVDTSYALAQVASNKKDISKAIFHTLGALKKLNESPDIVHEISSTQLKISLSETLIENDLADVGNLFMKSVSLKKDIPSKFQEYMQAYDKTIKKSFFNVIYDYQLKMKNNILQLSDISTTSIPEQVNSLTHHNRLNIYNQTQLTKKYSLISGVDLTNQSSLSSKATEANFTSLSTDVELKEFSLDSTLSSYKFRFDLLNGRELASLEEIQFRSQQVLSYERLWITPNAKWSYVIPFFIKQYSKRNSLAIAPSLIYEDFNTSHWWNPKYQGSLGLQQEGQSLGSTLYLDLAISNKYKISKSLSLESFLSFYKQFNSQDFLNYNQLSFELYLSFQPNSWKQASLFSSFSLDKRVVQDDTSYKMTDINLGFKYNF